MKRVAVDILGKQPIAGNSVLREQERGSRSDDSSDFLDADMESMRKERPLRRAVGVI
jgi:hypothetical protein